MERLTPHVEQALEEARTPALDEHTVTEPFTRCQGINKDGSQCKGTIGLNAQGLCSLHAGKVDRDAARAASHERRRQAAEREQQALEAQADAARRSKLAPRAALALRLAERQEEALDILMQAAIDDRDTQLLLRLWTEAFGKPGEAAPEAPVEQPSLESVVEQWERAMRQQGLSVPRGDAPSTQAPDGAA